MSTQSAEGYFVGRHLEIARAIERRDIAALKASAVGVDLSAIGRKDMTLMWFALTGRGGPHLEAIQILVSLGVNPDLQIAPGLGSALDYAFLNKDTRILRSMLDGGLSPNHTSPRHKLMLQRAVTATLAHVQMLVERGSDLNARDSIGGTALHEAVNRDRPDIGIFLLHQGANAQTWKSNGASVAWSVLLTLRDMQAGSVRSQFEALQALLIEKGVPWPPESPEQIRERMRLQGLTPAAPPGKLR